MSRSSGSSSTTTRNSGCGGGGSSSKKLKGVRRRKWGKWVSEIRVPGTQERLWLGTYATPEAAAVAHDVAVYCLRKPSSLDKLNFPETVSSYSVFHQQNRDLLSPSSVQKLASDVAMDVDARNIAAGGGSRMQSTIAAESSCYQRGGNKSDGGDNNNNNNNNGDRTFGGGDDDDDDDSGGRVSWWDDLGADSSGDALSISVEDYL